MNRTYIVTGPPGVGKTTISALLASEFDLGIHIHCDDIYNMVKGGHKMPWEDTNGFLMNTMFDAVANIQQTYSNRGFTCVVDYVFHLAQLKQLIVKLTGMVSLTVLLPNISINIERDKHREWTIGEERVHFYHDYFNKQTDVLSPFMIDNGEASPEEIKARLMALQSYTPEALINRLM